MKVLKKIVIVLFLSLIAIQVPFVYRRYKFGQLREKIDKIASVSRNNPKPANPNFTEYKGIIHAHTSLGGHSTGGFDELIEAANSNGLDFVLMTEHYSPNYDTSSLTLNGTFGKTLFVGGNEIDTSDADRFLMIPGSADAPGLARIPTEQVIEKLHGENRLVMVTYPEKLRSWNASFDGVEVFSLHTAAKQLNPFVAFFDLIWSGSAYPELVFASGFRRPDANLSKYDLTAATRKTSLFSGTDAHSNIGLHLFGDDAGHKWINLKIDPYATMFGIVRTHVLIENDKPLSREILIENIKRGRYFVGLDIIGDTTGFQFWAETTQGNGYMGDTASLGNKPILRSTSPISARFVLFKDGAEVANASGSNELSFVPSEPGTYRVEVYQNDLGSSFDSMPWIISNPIYVR